MNLCGISDKQVMELARREERLLITSNLSTLKLELYSTNRGLPAYTKHGYFRRKDFARQRYGISVDTTLDMHFSNVFLFPPSECPGIIVIRVKPAVPSKVDQALKCFLQALQPEKVINALIIVEENKFRIRK